MPITFYGSRSQTAKTSGTTLVMDLSAAPKVNVGSLLVICFAHDVAAGTYSVADTQGHTYRPDFEADFGSNLGVHIWSTISTFTGFINVTITHPTLTARAAFGVTLDGASQALTGTKGSATGTSTSPSSPSLTPAVDGAAVFGFVGREGPGITDAAFTNDAAYAAGTLASPGTTGGSGASNISGGLGVLVQGTAAATTYDATLGASVDWLAVAIAYGPDAASIPPRGVRATLQAVNRASTY